MNAGCPRLACLGTRVHTFDARKELGRRASGSCDPPGIHDDQRQKKGIAAMPNSDGTVTATECKEVVRSTGMTELGHHRCGVCGSMIGFTFRRETGVHPSWQTELGLDGPNDIVVWFDPSCDCGSWRDGQPQSWNKFAHTFNMQDTPEKRIAMFERFKSGKPTHE